jgi:hypothetical protein
MLDGNVTTSRSVTELLGENEAFVDFIEDSIRLVLSFEKPFLVCQREGSHLLDPGYIPWCVSQPGGLHI